MPPAKKEAIWPMIAEQGWRGTKGALREGCHVGAQEGARTTRKQLVIYMPFKLYERRSAYPGSFHRVQARR
jgi:hypothetical protein